ncbi:cation:proton antiporter [Clostridium peptidivorans]|uniref:cation:proton antiporter n=1 Tax=Clostridium peptidivorans TaxID=100174 RepID=UPI000BE3F66E|nr:cation:proton antiporter [Clostridium peptidivorans]
MSIEFLMDIVIILLSTKLFGLLAKRFQMPQVVGALLAGLIIGPALLGLVHSSDFLSKLSKLGVLLLMFTAGLETDLDELKKSGKASFIIAIAGVVVPLVGGLAVAGFFNNDGKPFSGDLQTLLQNIFIGIVLTATSVSITVETLQEMGKLKTPSGTAILGAAIIDDILGIVLLTIVTSVSNPSVDIKVVLFKIAAFFVVSAVVGVLFYRGFNKLSSITQDKKDLSIFALIFCFTMSFGAEHFFGVADITGAYIAGLVLSKTKEAHSTMATVETISTTFLSPMFFANIGIGTVITGMNTKMVIFTALLLVVAILSKVVGCNLGARACGYSKEESLQIGTGMISRGEVALIVANIGVSMNLMKEEYFAPLILVVIVTTIITPILLKVVYADKKESEKDAILETA